MEIDSAPHQDLNSSRNLSASRMNLLNSLRSSIALLVYWPCLRVFWLPLGGDGSWKFLYHHKNSAGARTRGDQLYVRTGGRVWRAAGEEASTRLVFAKRSAKNACSTFEDRTVRQYYYIDLRTVIRYAVLP